MTMDVTRFDTLVKYPITDIDQGVAFTILLGVDRRKTTEGSMIAWGQPIHNKLITDENIYQNDKSIQVFSAVSSYIYFLCIC